MHCFFLKQLRDCDFFKIPQRTKGGEDEQPDADTYGEQYSFSRIGRHGKWNIHNRSKQCHHQLKKHKTCAHAGNQSKAGNNPALADKQGLNIPSCHTQGKVHAEFFFAQLQHEPCGIAEYQCRDQTCQYGYQSEHGAHIV